MGIEVSMIPDGSANDALTGSQVFGKAWPPQICGHELVCARHHDDRSDGSIWETVMERLPEVE